MKELVVISGKGGTGKTSFVASFAALARPIVLVDCDVDAADLHLVVEPHIRRRNDFVGGKKAVVTSGHCTACGKCAELCRFDAIHLDSPGNGRVTKTYRVDASACEGCGVCVEFCPENAIAFLSEVSGQWFVSETRCGPMIHARLAVAAENSGKLVTQLRRVAEETAKIQCLDLVICDGAPGIGCPVIASLTGADLALVVAEPTVSGLRDFERLAQLLRQLGIPGLLAINKADLNADNVDRLETSARRMGISPVGRIPYDVAVTKAQLVQRSVVETSNGLAAKAIRGLWRIVEGCLRSATPNDSLMNIGSRTPQPPKTAVPPSL